jgi:hypothetical protein
MKVLADSLRMLYYVAENGGSFPEALTEEEEVDMQHHCAGFSRKLPDC